MRPADSFVASQIRALLTKRKNAPTTETIHRSVRGGVAEIDDTLQAMVEAGSIRCINGLWVLVERLMVDNRKPRGPKKLDPKSAEARTLPLEFYRGKP